MGQDTVLWEAADMHAMTAENLRTAFGGESMAHVRYKLWAKRAQQDGFANVARLFAAVSFAEEVHASKHFKRLKEDAGAFSVTAGGGFGLGTTAANLANALAGEAYEVSEMYPAFLEVAHLQGEQDAVKSFTYAHETEKAHAMLYRRAKEAVALGQDVELGPVYVCDHCGWTIEGEAPEKCPLCAVKRERFVEYAS